MAQELAAVKVAADSPTMYNRHNCVTNYGGTCILLKGGCVD